MNPGALFVARQVRPDIDGRRPKSRTRTRRLKFRS
jgi:hypothetical protein